MKTQKIENPENSKNTKYPNISRIISFFIFIVLSILIVIISDKSYRSYIKDINKSIEQNDSNKNNLRYLKVPTTQKDYIITCSIIKEHIQEVNPSVSDYESKIWAKVIVDNAKRCGYSPFIHTSLIESESPFERAPHHLMKCDRGMTGINVVVWGDELKRVGIINSISDLDKPVIAINASSYIFNLYMKQYKGKTFNALAGYKGFCSAGKVRARNVIIAANKLKQIKYSA
jgi:hypothetical protein